MDLNTLNTAFLLQNWNDIAMISHNHDNDGKTNLGQSQVIKACHISTENYNIPCRIINMSYLNTN